LPKVKVQPQLVFKELQNGRNYKSSENLYRIIERNEKYYASEQWPNGGSNKLPKTVYNFIKQVAQTQVSTVMSQQITINRSADELSKENDQVNKAAQAFTEMDKRNWERVKMDAMNEQVLLDAYLAGIGGSHWFWDDDIVTGNDFVTKGDFDGEIVDSVQIYVSNPNEVKIQKQDWTMLSQRMTIQQVKEKAKANGIPEQQIELIKGNETTTYEAYDKANNEQDSDKINSNQTDLITKFWKQEGTVWFTQVTSEVVIKKPTNTGLKLYPIAIFPWESRKRFIYGNSPVTAIVPNQQVANKQASMRHLHAQLMAIPKVVYNKSVMAGFTNTIGGVTGVNAEPGANLSNSISYIQPTAMTIDVDKSINDGINRTKDLMGVNQNVTGEANPDNFRAIIAQQKAAGVPLEMVKRKFFQYIEDVALIWLDYYQNKYNMVRKVLVEEDGEEEVVAFQGTDFKDIYLKTKIDVGASTQWSELLQIDALGDLYDKQVINGLQYVERLPANIIPEQEKLIEELGGGDEAKQEKKTAMFKLMVQFMATQPPELQEQFKQLPPEEQEKFVISLINQGGATGEVSNVQA